MGKEPKKKKFKRLLAGELVDWKEHAMRLTHLMVDAEVREKDFCNESRYFYDAVNEMHKDLGYTEEQIEFAHESYIKWYEERKEDDEPF